MSMKELRDKGILCDCIKIDQE